jgi:hypothetical protein
LPSTNQSSLSVVSSAELAVNVQNLPAPLQSKMNVRMAAKQGYDNSKINNSLWYNALTN